ncbi:MAG: sensor histidine kinase, partial [Leptolyngbya sp. SIO4C1]|nr:sensor histidine kinase [Leptolyngbya sp. SIO4C1]
TSINQITQMLDRLLLVDRPPTDQISCNLQTADLVQWCQTLMDELQAANHQHQLKFTAEIVQPAVAQAAFDTKLLRQVLCNVVSNAIKYSEPTTRVELSLRLCEESLCFSLKDEGIGIPEEEQALVFQPFYRSKNANHVAGTGLGLTIARRFATLQGGYIRLTSQIAQGTQVDIVLPNQRPSK